MAAMLSDILQNTGMLAEKASTSVVLSHIQVCHAAKLHYRIQKSRGTILMHPHYLLKTRSIRSFSIQTPIDGYQLQKSCARR